MRVELDGGEIVELGATETAPTIGITDYSRRTTDDFGVTTVVQRGFSRRMSVRMLVPTSGADALQRRLADLRATAARFVADDRYASLSVDGFYKDFSLDLNVPPVSYCTLTVEGLAETVPFIDTDVDPAPDGQTSTLRLLQPLAITTAMLTASSLAEADYPEWSGAISYDLGARVMKGATHRVYETVVAANLGNDPSGDAGKWVDVGPTNRWAMFDEALGTLSSADETFTVTLAPGTPINALALLDVTATTVRVQTADYDRTSAPASTPGMVLFLNMPSSDEPVTVTVTGGGTVSVGTLLIGRIVGLGITEASPTASITDYSRKETDDFGEVTIVERAWAKAMTAAALISTEAIDAVFGRVATVRARPSLWIGEEELESVTVYGFFKDFSITVGESVSKLSLSIEGLSTAAPVAGALTNTSIVFHNSPLQPATPVDGTGSVPPGWSVAPETLAYGSYRWWTQAQFLGAEQKTSWTVPVKVAGTSWGDVVDDDPAKPKPDDGATNSADPNSPIGDGGKTVAGVLADIDGLFDTYGDTASAAVSAAAAEAFMQAAENAKTETEGQVTVAAGHAQVARDEADAAEGSAISAAGSAQVATTKAGEAGGSAEASARDATAAATSRTDAGLSAQAAHEDALSASVSKGDAAASAGIARDERVIATEKAAAAQQSATVAASVSRGSINPNPMFADYPNGIGEPANWTPWSYDSGTQPQRGSGENGIGYAVRGIAQANLNQGSMQTSGNVSAFQTVQGEQWVVIEARFKLVSGTLRGAGVFLNRSSQGAYINGDGYNFASGLGVGTVGRTYSISKLMQLPPNTALIDLYRMDNWEGWGQRDAKTLDWYLCSIRPATAEEIRSGTAIPALQATTTQQTGAIADLNGKTAAFWKVQAVAGSGRAQLSVFADANGGGGVDIVGDTAIHGNLVVNGTISTVKVGDQAIDRTKLDISAKVDNFFFDSGHANNPGEGGYVYDLWTVTVNYSAWLLVNHKFNISTSSGTNFWGQCDLQWSPAGSGAWSTLFPGFGWTQAGYPADIFGTKSLLVSPGAYNFRYWIRGRNTGGWLSAVQSSFLWGTR
ncbi:MAG TPA: hypothetical protein VF503_20590 [Sphingobium sp.]|uniref:hypothetical protein n=1 Tax=Sphingobium sp. TaxID=1912891 RepID=UPI002ED1F545